jgi:hypothetical protein
MKRQMLDQLRPGNGTHLRVFFPHGLGAREMVASGQTRPSGSERYKLGGDTYSSWYYRTHEKRRTA